MPNQGKGIAQGTPARPGPKPAEEIITPRQISDALAFLGWSQRELARQSGMSHTSVKGYVMGKYPAPQKIVSSLLGAVTERMNPVLPDSLKELIG